MMGSRIRGTEKWPPSLRAVAESARISDAAIGYREQKRI